MISDDLRADLPDPRGGGHRPGKWGKSTVHRLDRFLDVLHALGSEVIVREPKEQGSRQDRKGR